MLKYIAQILPNGEIQALRLPKGANNTPEGYLEDGTFILYINFDIENKPFFMENYYYSFSLNDFVQREPRPNSVAYWENNSWTWNPGDFLDLVRTERSLKLFESDWTQALDAPLTPQQVVEARVYRQELRDIVDVCVDFSRVEDIPWPTKPDFI